MGSDGFFIDLLIFVVFVRLTFALVMILLEQLGLKERQGVKITMRRKDDD